MFCCAEPAWMMDFAQAGKQELKREQQEASSLWDSILKTSQTIQRTSAADNELTIINGKDLLELLRRVSAEKGLEFDLASLNHIANNLSTVLKDEDSFLRSEIPVDVRKNTFRHIADVGSYLYSRKGYFVFFETINPKNIGEALLSTLLKYPVVIKFEKSHKVGDVVIYARIPVVGDGLLSFVSNDPVLFVAVVLSSDGSYALTNTVRIPVRIKGRHLQLVTAYPVVDATSKCYPLNMDIDFVPTRSPYIWRFGLVFQQIKADLEKNKILAEKLSRLRAEAEQQKMKGLDQCLLVSLQAPTLLLSSPIEHDNPSDLTHLSLSASQVTESLEAEEMSLLLASSQGESTTKSSFTLLPPVQSLVAKFENFLKTREESERRVVRREAMSLGNQMTKDTAQNEVNLLINNMIYFSLQIESQTDEYWAFLERILVFTQTINKAALEAVEEAYKLMKIPNSFIDVILDAAIFDQLPR